MRSSISSSSLQAWTYARALCGVCIVFLLALEGFFVYLVKYRSVSYRRVSQQLVEAIGARQAEPGEQASVVMIGNSLFLNGVQVERLQELTAARLRIYPIFLESTGYYDWLYALQRIFRLGGRPQVVVVELEVNSFLWNRVRTQYSPLLFFDAPDVFRVGSELGLDRTAVSNLLLAHWSAFWSTHSTVRTQILLHAIPRFSDLSSLIQAQLNSSLPPELEAIAEARLKALRDLCAEYGAKLIMLAPPTPSSEDALRKLVSVSQHAGVAAMVPIHPSTLTAAQYEADAFHLNSQGAALFTSAIAGISGSFYKSGGETSGSAF